MPQDGTPVRQGTRHNAMLPLARNLESREGMTARFGVTEALIATLPTGCKSVRVGNVAYTQCGTTYYQRVATGYQVVVPH
jgi:hypothetical protein